LSDEVTKRHPISEGIAIYDTYMGAIHYSVRDNGVIRKLAAYVILGINAEGKKKF
jgi:hypothetical protein